MGKVSEATTIIFFEDKNFQGQCYECSTDCSDLHTFFARCNSIRVEGGSWVLYEKTNFTGYQYILTRGEYPDFQHWNGYNDSIKSCRQIRHATGGKYKIRVYERTDFSGQMMEFSDDCPSIHDRFPSHEIHSCQVLEGAWIFFEHANYRGRQYLLEKGEYKRYSDWGASFPTVGSCRRVTEF
ncbi:gamma-crystallin S-1-like [Callorhinchus milii]|uniref:gamma-crystallin S-1-like n=1 Tax=Callorhinchus milii TaxID=7868 RepID=UPI0004574C65|nr:gamma-crystallin S-1-like [Callorhinchus milii]|eukprot:gi/632964222/ref/XP_007898295.1/ PREDICTED: beta-crystallin S-1-like [Callorhinchus milii]